MVAHSKLREKMKCPTCNKELGKFVSDEQSMKEYGECFECNFWRKMLEKDKKRVPYTYCMVDGTHYVIGPEDSNFKGFDGEEFHIHFKDGHEVITHNLWCQGEPDEHWRPQFPDTADFDWQWKKIGKGTYLVPKEELPF